jgi:hypothetical protein
VTADEEWGVTKLAIAVDNQQPNYVEYRAEPRGPSEYVVLVEGEEIWRGDDADQRLADAVTKAAAKNFLSDQQG